MPNDGVERTISEITPPLLQAVRHLAPHTARISAAWHQRMGRYELCRRHAAVLQGLHLTQRMREGANTVPRVYRDEAEKQGGDLARRGVPAECAVLAVSIYVDCCLGYLTAGDSKSLRWRSALVRWGSIHQLALLSGYARFTAAESMALEERTALAERRSQDLVVELGEAYERERRRLAQDLHDEIGHDLIVLKLYVQVIALDLKKGEVRQLRGKLREAISLIDHALKGVRHLVFDLGPAVWNEQGFIPAVRLYVRQFAARTGLKVRFNARRLTTSLPKRYETAMYKILQGALANVAAHAAASRVAITLANRRESVEMVIEDDGKGFDVDHKLKALSRSYGLRAMRDRIELLGGSIQFTSISARQRRSKRGTRIELLLPLHSEETT
jgi:signal transduction histidine kinase